VTAGTQYWLRFKRQVGAALTWIGIAAFSSPASSTRAARPTRVAAVVPVSVPRSSSSEACQRKARRGAHSRHRRLPLGGKLSYSLYLWSWPVLTIAEQETTKISLSGSDFSPYWRHRARWRDVCVIENPIRHPNGSQTLVEGVSWVLSSSRSCSWCVAGATRDALDLTTTPVLQRCHHCLRSTFRTLFLTAVRSAGSCFRNLVPLTGAGTKRCNATCLVGTLFRKSTE